MRGDLSIFLFNADSEFHAFFVVLKGGFTQAQFVIFKSPPSHHFKVEQLLDVPAKSKNASRLLARHSERRAHFAFSRRPMRGSG